MLETRRRFLFKSGQISMLPLFTLAHSFSACSSSTAGKKGEFFRMDDGETWYIGNTRKAKVTIKVSKAQNPSAGFSLLKEIIPPGDFIPEHKHQNEDEFIFIEKGAAKVLIGEDNETLNPGDLAFIPKQIWHGLKNEGNDYIHMFFGYSPAGFEDYFRQIGVRKTTDSPNLTGSEFEIIGKKYGVTYR
jgi:quercetin dioxygenase-like cupin family protein